MSVIIIVASIFILLGVIQLFINFNISLLVTIILTLIVGAMYIYTDKQCKNQDIPDVENVTEPCDICEPECIEELDVTDEASEDENKDAE